MPRKQKKEIDDVPDEAFPPFKIPTLPDSPDEGGTERQPTKQAVPPEGRSGPVDDLDGILEDIEVLPGKGEPEEKAKKSPKEKKAEADAAKKEEERRIMLKKYPVDVGAIGTVCKAGFGTAAIFGGQHWELTDEEAKKLDSAWKPVVERFGPEALLKWLPVLGAIVITIMVIGAKVKIGQDIEKKKKDAEKAKKAQAEENDHQRRLREIEEAAQRGERRVAQVPPAAGAKA
jgi:hypothetical protein